MEYKKRKQINHRLQHELASQSKERIDMELTRWIGWNLDHKISIDAGLDPLRDRLMRQLAGRKNRFPGRRV